MKSNDLENAAFALLVSVPADKVSKSYLRLSLHDTIASAKSDVPVHELPMHDVSSDINDVQMQCVSNNKHNVPGEVHNVPGESHDVPDEVHNALGEIQNVRSEVHDVPSAVSEINMSGCERASISASDSALPLLELLLFPNVALNEDLMCELFANMQFSELKFDMDRKCLYVCPLIVSQLTFSSLFFQVIPSSKL